MGRGAQYRENREARAIFIEVLLRKLGVALGLFVYMERTPIWAKELTERKGRSAVGPRR